MIQKLKREDFKQVFQIMEKSFPADEYRTFEEQEALLNHPVYHIYAIYDNTEIKALVGKSDIERENYVLKKYLTDFTEEEISSDSIFFFISERHLFLASYAPHAICGVKSTLSRCFILL